jgi:hypothetical protein
LAELKAATECTTRATGLGGSSGSEDSKNGERGKAHRAGTRVSQQNDLRKFQVKACLRHGPGDLMIIHPAYPVVSGQTEADRAAAVPRREMPSGEGPRVDQNGANL